MSPTATDFIPLTPLSFHVLLALRHGARHGYAIGTSIDETSEGALSAATRLRHPPRWAGGIAPS